MKTPSATEIEEALRIATRAVALEFGPLLSAGISERALTHRLAVELEFRCHGLFDGWHVDCEYNRREERGKVVDSGHVLPDVVVHQRGTTANLLAVEAKRWATEVDACDRRKLLSYREQLGYAHVYFVAFSPEPRVWAL